MVKSSSSSTTQALSGEPEKDCAERQTNDETLRACERRALFGADAQPNSAIQGVALAFSGGGIRSAAFALGALQALLDAKCFNRFDFLSTVSGGGYLGTAISWLKRETARDASAGDRDARFSQQFGWAGAGARHSVEANRHNVWLDYIRQHGNYLQPGSVSTMALAATVLRGALFNLAVYGLLLVVMLAWMIHVQILPGTESTVSWLDGPLFALPSWVLLFALLFGSSVLLYGSETWLSSQRRGIATAAGLAATTSLIALTMIFFTGYGLPADWLSDAALHWRAPVVTAAAFNAGVSVWTLWCLIVQRQDAAANPANPGNLWHYRVRLAYIERLGDFLSVTLALLILWSVPSAHQFLGYQLRAMLAGGAGALLGAAGGLYQFIAGRSQGAAAGWIARLRIMSSALLVIYGTVLLAYALADAYFADLPVVYLIGCAAFALAIGLLINTNYYGLGRMYRDRLMESFMPNQGTIETNTWGPATDADRAALTDFRYVPSPAQPTPSAHTSSRTQPPSVQRPLHLVNCSVVLVDAASDTFRGRGGDSFLLSPWFCGSNATGWVPTAHFGDGALSLATAMAISGAAANPDAAVAGRGVTRNRFVSFLMSALNVRLGYWLPNPARGRDAGRTFAPNLWRPGLRQGLLGRGLNERATYIELTDGGHFDNTALYELIRRRVKVIVLCEGGQDNAYRLDDLANAIEKVRVDFGVHIRFNEPVSTNAAAPPQYDLEGLRPDRHTGLSRRGYAIGTIRYPNTRDPSVTPTYDEGTLIYLQTAPVADMRPDTQSYWRQHQDFPNESTANQFFTEEQLEAYRELGLRIGRAAMAVVKDGQTSTYEPLARAYRALFG